MTCSGEQRVTTMVLKVDLDCHRCFRKVKKLLCQFPQIRNQMFDEKNNVVIITVVSCNPEKIRDKLCRKGSSFINSIEIKPPPPLPPVRPIPLPTPDVPAPPKPTPPNPTPTPTPAPEKPKPVPPRPAPPVAQWPPLLPPCPPGWQPCPPSHMFPVAVCYIPWPGWPDWPGCPCRCNGFCSSWCCRCWCHDNSSVCSIM